MPNIDEILKTSVEKNASDIHFTVGRSVTYRINGNLEDFGAAPLKAEEVTEVIKKVTSESQYQEFKDMHCVEFGFGIEGGERFRASAFRQKNHDALVLRHIPNDILKMDTIGLPPIINKLLDKNHGMILLAGPTGSGKSTTLASMIDYINENDDRHIITIEDPIEYVHNHKKSIINQRELNVDTPAYATALIQALRQDPDVVLVGEMRDLQTIETALTATETGHLVFSTVHTFGAARSLDRIIDVFPAHQQNQIRTQLSLNLAAVISQQLIPRCDKPGRVAALEVMILTPAIQNLIRKGQTYNIPNEIQTGSKFGMFSLQNSLLELTKQGIISKEDAVFYAIDQEDVAKRVGL